MKQSRKICALSSALVLALAVPLWAETPSDWKEKNDAQKLEYVKEQLENGQTLSGDAAKPDTPAGWWHAQAVQWIKGGKITDNGVADLLARSFLTPYTLVPTSGPGAESIVLGNKDRRTAYPGVVVLGHDALASGPRDVAIGSGAFTLRNGEDNSGSSVAIGSSAHARGLNSLALGEGAELDGDRSVALGAETNVQRQDSVAIGSKAATFGVGDIVIGSDATSGRQGSMPDPANLVIGYEAKGQGAFQSVLLGYRIAVEPNKTHDKTNHAVGLGPKVSIKNSEAVAIGMEAAVAGHGAVALGPNAEADENADWGVALGTFAGASAEKSAALGSYAKAKVPNSVALGPSSVADKAVDGKAAYTEEEIKAENGVISVAKPQKYRRIVNLAGGLEDHDAVTLGQLKKALEGVSGGSSTVRFAGAEDQPAAEYAVKNLTFKIGDGLKMEEEGTADAKTLVFSLDKETLKKDPAFKGADGQNGQNGKDGQPGKPGLNGKDGKDGKDGVGLADARLEGGKLIFKLADGRDLKPLDLPAGGGEGIAAGDANLTVTRDNGTATVALNKNLTADSLTLGNVKLTKAGLDSGGQPITNLGEGRQDTDAATLGQVRKLINAQGAVRVEGLQKEIGALKKDLYAGLASGAA